MYIDSAENTNVCVCVFFFFFLYIKQQQKKKLRTAAAAAIINDDWPPRSASQPAIEEATHKHAHTHIRPYEVLIEWALRMRSAFLFGSILYEGECVKKAHPF